MELSVERVGRESLTEPWHYVRRDAGALRVRGKDRHSWLSGLLTCDLSSLSTHGLAEGLFLSKNGRILSSAEIVPDAKSESIVVVLPRSRTEPILEHLDRYQIMEDVEVLDETGAFSSLVVAGVGAADLPEAKGAAAVDREILPGQPGKLVWSSGEGVDVLSSMAAALVKAGSREVSDDDFEVLRILAGVPRWGIDYDESTYPQEAGLERRMVSFNKGCYLGQEVVCMLELRGHVRRHLVYLALDVLDGTPPVRGARVTLPSGEDVGELTSVAVRGNEGRALAMVARKSAIAEARFRVGTVAAALLPWSFCP